MWQEAIGCFLSAVLIAVLGGATWLWIIFLIAAFLLMLPSTIPSQKKHRL